jgi:hypothetical protein
MRSPHLEITHTWPPKRVTNPGRVSNMPAVAGERIDRAQVPVRRPLDTGGPGVLQ